MTHSELMMNRIKEMGLSLKDIYKREKAYLKAIHNKEYAKYSVYVEDLGLTQCWYSNKRKIKSPVYVKVSIYTVFKYYINLGIVFRDKKKRYYTMEEVEKLLIEYYKDKNIEFLEDYFSYC